MRSNLPPGVTASMIPGNGPKDEERENLIEKLAIMIDLELEDSILNSKTPIPWRQGGFIPKKLRARMIRRATNTCNEKLNKQGKEHYSRTIPI